MEQINNNSVENKNNKQAKKKIGIFLGAVAIIGIIYGIYWFTVGKYFVETEDAYVNSNQTVVTSQVSGIIKEIYVEDTQNVKNGELLAVIDDTDYKIALDNAAASLGKTVRAYSNLSSNVILNKNAVSVRESELKKAQINFDMDKKSYKAGLISKHQYEISKNNLDIAKASLNQSIKSFEEAKIQAESEDIYSHPEVQQGIAAYKTAYVNLMRTKIYATDDGVIAKKSIFIGQKVNPSQQLMSIINLNDIWVDANYKETQLKNIKIGNEAEIVSDINGKTYTGHVQGISGGSGSALSLLPAQNATGNWIKVVQRVPVRIVIDKHSLDKNGIIPIGSSVLATVNLKEEISQVSEYKKNSTALYSVDEEKLNKEIDNIIKNNINKR